MFFNKLENFNLFFACVTQYFSKIKWYFEEPGRYTLDTSYYIKKKYI